MIELKNVCFQISGFSIRNLSLRVDANQYAVIMGRTGIGKTTILEMICGLRRVQSGQILVRGQDVTDWPPNVRNIGYVPQDLALFPTLSVKEHLAFALKLRKYPSSEIQKRVNDLANRLSIQPILSRSVVGLSGGEAQRVALGRALAYQPNVLLLDEPLSALDSSTRQSAQVLLKELTRELQMTVLHVTHNRDEATALADVIYELELGGQLRQLDTNAKTLPTAS